jgi:MoaA/NifB/PqqE/SkfB family radical SAM enzyme
VRAPIQAAPSTPGELEMNIGDLTQAAVAHVMGNFSERLYLSAGRDITKPRVIRAIINERCNYRCKYCHFWRQDRYRDEMTIEQWQATLHSLKEFIGRYTIQFSGGEPFIKKGFLKLLDFCHHEGINWGAITNGSTLSRGTVERIVAAHPMNLDISVDGTTAEIHDTVRGIPGSLQQITRGIGLLRTSRDRHNLNFPIRIKPTVHRLNFRNLPALVEWAETIGATTIDFSPVRTSPMEFEADLWIRDQAELNDLRQICETLVDLKRTGAAIETSEEKLLSFPDHFEEKVVRTGVSPCRVGLREYQILADGNVRMCWFFPPIGNVKTHSAREIWYGETAQHLRSQMTGCTKFGTVDCANSCLAHRSLKQEIKRGLLLLRRSGAETAR